MKKIISYLVVLLFAAQSLTAQNVFSLNTIGYLPQYPKVATVSVETQTFSLVDVQSGEIVYSSDALGPFAQANVEKTVWKLDFSAFKKEGTYRLETNNGNVSPVFSIENGVYKHAFETAFRAFYLWRCGMAVEAEYNGQTYSHEACHLEDAYLDYVSEKGIRKDGIGGWHDAGDYGKYVVNAGVSTGIMFFAWSHFADLLEDYTFDLPETAPGFPDFLKELKWETDWLLKMQYPDGSGRISHKLTRIDFSSFIMPEDDKEKRYFTQWSSAATANFAAALAQASRFFRPYDAQYADICLAAAEKSYRFLSQNPEYKPFEQGDFNTGGYQSRDMDDRLWAAAELWESTGKEQYLDDFEKRLDNMSTMVDQDWDWPNVRNLAVFTYLQSNRDGRNVSIEQKAKNALIAVADSIVKMAAGDVFRRPLGSVFYWGCNGTVARQVLNLQMAYRFNPDKAYIEAALDAVHHLFGSNSYGRSFVTGLGYNPPMYPHDRRSGADNIGEPWPGYIVGGGQTATNWVDEEASYSTNEIAINWQAALVYALAGFVNP
ncbi:MAG: glycoside hydrolase family 9 protein [Prolixibacteraceae bacterium]|nr:glycoside hydrolase family 9 protein [Prolixibacteraceae bacterium]MBN2650720.1 glycoside hydrolase family 9 protein [Prolixibacteraceae bacterium]